MSALHVKQQSKSLQYVPSLQDYKSLRDFKDSKEVKKLKFSSKEVQDTLNPKSDKYANPNIPDSIDAGPMTWRIKMAPLKHPDKVNTIRKKLHLVRSKTYGLLQDHREKEIKTQKAREYGTEGPETDTATTANHDRNYFEFPQTEAEMQKYTRMQKEYLEFLIEMGFQIPKDKTELFRILIMKDFGLNQERAKKKSKLLDKLETENKELVGQLSKIDRKTEAKIISQANKNFNIHLHLNRLLKEEPEYLDELNDLISKKLLYFTNPVAFNKLLEQSQKKAVKPNIIALDDITSPLKKNESTVSSPNAKQPLAYNETVNSALQDMQQPKTQVLPSLNSRLSDLKSPEKQKPRSDSISMPELSKGGKSSLHFGPKNSIAIVQTPVDKKLDEESQTQQFKEYYGKLYKKYKVKRRQNNIKILKKTPMEDQFDFFIKTLNQTPLELKHASSERFLQANRFLPDDLFSKKKSMTETSGPLCDPAEQQKYFAMSEERSNLFFESQRKIVKLMNTIDQKEKKFLIKALRTE